MYFPASCTIADKHPDLVDQIRAVDRFLCEREKVPFHIESAADFLGMDSGLLERLLRYYLSDVIVETSKVYICPEDGEIIEPDESGDLWCDLCEENYPPEECETKQVYLVAKPAPIEPPIDEPTLSRLRQQLATLDDPEIEALCLDHFPDVYDKFSRGLRRDEKINLLLDHCRRRSAERTRLARILSQSIAPRPVLPAEPTSRTSPSEPSLTARQGYEAFELLVGRKIADGYPVTITHAPAGDASDICQLDPAADNLQAALRRIEAENTDEGFLIEFGRRLFEELFAGDIASVFRASLGQARGQKMGLQIRLRIESPELAALPWEYLYDAQEDCFMAISSETPLVRYVPVRGPTRPTAVSPPLRVLVVISNPKDAMPLDTDQEKAIIEGALHKWVTQGLVQLLVLERAVVAEISQAMRSFRPHVFHFIGHGQYQDEKAHVILEDDDGHARPVGERTFREFFLGMPDARLAVLNACQTATTSSARLLTGVSPRLLQRHLSAVAAMQYPMPDEAAQVFSREFYRSLALGHPVDAAMAEARKGIFLEVGSGARDWGIPVLFLRAQDGRLFEVAERKGAKAEGGVESRREMHFESHPAGAVIGDHAQQRCADLAESIRETLDLIKEYQEQRRLADDPKTKRRAERETADLREQLAGYEAEYRALGCK